MKNTKWTFKDTIECYKRGFAPFTKDNKEVEIMALDEPDAVAYEHGFAPFSGHRFIGDNRDLNAERYCKRHSKKGDKLCQRVLDICSKR